MGFSKWKILSGKNDDFVPNLNSENQVVINFSLQPNQSFLLRHNKIIEGKDVSLISKKENKK